MLQDKSQKKVEEAKGGIIDGAVAGKKRSFAEISQTKPKSKTKFVERNGHNVPLISAPKKMRKRAKLLSSPDEVEKMANLNLLSSNDKSSEKFQSPEGMNEARSNGPKSHENSPPERKPSSSNMSGMNESRTSGNSRNPLAGQEPDYDPDYYEE